MIVVDASGALLLPCFLARIRAPLEQAGS